MLENNPKIDHVDFVQVMIQEKNLSEEEIWSMYASHCDEIKVSPRDIFVFLGYAIIKSMGRLG